MSSQSDLSTLFARLTDEGFAFVGADVMRGLLDNPQSLDDWEAFTASWNDLGPDSYLAAQGRKRRRRHTTFTATADGSINRNPQQPHYQTLQHNPLQGDLQRWFMPVRPEIADGPSFQHILKFTHALFGTLSPRIRAWHVEAHQFRIEASVDEAGEPTPEGVHHDGVDYVLVLLVDRTNIESGTTTIHGADGALLGSFTLTRPLDAALVDDARVSHGVTAVTPFDPTLPAHRDVLVLTFKGID
jgi:hypothetical protein